ncbi:MAG TPA: hypothetical protein VFF52_18220 [Isosphaeraceae bacterium]|nr:hypothetical protein [Isosphaeraceae bacterium]
MAGARRFGETALILLAIAVRVAAVLVLRSYDVSRSTYEHGEIAANLLAGHGFSMRFLGAEGPTSQQAPVYPLCVAAAYALGGVGTPRALLILELGQSVLGGLLVWGVLRLARLVAPGHRWLAAVAGLVVAVHPTLVYAATHVQVATLGTTVLVWTLAAGYQAGATGRPRDAVIAGGWLALLALTDPILSLASIGVAWAIAQGRTGVPGRRRQSFRLTTLAIVTGLAGIAPWLARNVQVHGELVAIKSTFGYAFWQGNCALSEGTDKVRRSSVDRIVERSRTAASLSSLNRMLWTARHEAGYLDDIALTRADYRLLGSVTEPQRSRILFHRALAELRAEPWRYLRLCLRRLRYFLLFDETNPKSRVWAYRVAHLGLTLFALAGLLLASPGVRSRLLPTIAIAAALTVFHTLTIVSARFHIPIEPMMALWGAAGLTRWEAGRGGRSTPAPHHVEGIRVIHGLGLVEQRPSLDSVP